MPDSLFLAVERFVWKFLCENADLLQSLSIICFCIDIHAQPILDVGKFRGTIGADQASFGGVTFGFRENFPLFLCVSQNCGFVVGQLFLSSMSPAFLSSTFLKGGLPASNSYKSTPNA